MNDPEVKMMESIKEKYGKPFDHWVKLVRSQNFSKHGEILKYLKTEHGFTHGFANLVSHKSKGSDSSSQNNDTLISNQYKGKEHFKPLFDTLVKEISSFGADVQFAPKKAYVSLRRKKQFGALIPSTKTRFEIGINLKGQEGEGILEAITKSGSMFTHKINLSEHTSELKECIGWLKKAYANAG